MIDQLKRMIAPGYFLTPLAFELVYRFDDVTGVSSYRIVYVFGVRLIHFERGAADLEALL